MVKKLKKLDFRISGKIILAAAVLLRIKSSRLLEEDLNHLNQLIAQSEAHDDDFFEDIHDGPNYRDIDNDKFRLIPKTPQPRKRKVSVYDLVEALEKALEVKQRRIVIHDIETNVKVPEKPIDITVIIEEVYEEIRKMIAKHKLQKLDFAQLVPTGEKKDKVYAFMPLLYLDTQRKIDLEQKDHLGNIEIYVK
jgi:segregation and condensation protein A